MVIIESIHEKISEVSEQGFSILRNHFAGEIDMQAVPLEIGDVLIRHPWALHRGTPNMTDVPRVLATIRYARRWYADDRPRRGGHSARDVGIPDGRAARSDALSPVGPAGASGCQAGP
jgi:hypothetical protein